MNAGCRMRADELAASRQQATVRRGGETTAFGCANAVMDSEAAERSRHSGARRWFSWKEVVVHVEPEMRATAWLACKRI